MGLCGMSMSDFESLGYNEYKAVVNMWSKKHEAQRRDMYICTRLISAFSVLPHTRKRLKPEDLITFEWEKEQLPLSSSALSGNKKRSGSRMSVTERRARIESLVKEYEEKMKNAVNGEHRTE
jgi:hypothetical protein